MKSVFIKIASWIYGLVSWFNGRKTFFGTFLAVVYLGAVAQGLIDRNEAIEYFITVVLGVGLGHKVVKG